MPILVIVSSLSTVLLLFSRLWVRCCGKLIKHVQYAVTSMNSGHTNPLINHFPISMIQFFFFQTLSNNSINSIQINVFTFSRCVTHASMGSSIFIARQVLENRVSTVSQHVMSILSISYRSIRTSHSLINYLAEHFRNWSRSTRFVQVIWTWQLGHDVNTTTTTSSLSIIWLGTREHASASTFVHIQKWIA